MKQKGLPIGILFLIGSFVYTTCLIAGDLPCEELDQSLNKGISSSEATNSIFARDDVKFKSIINCKPELVKEVSPAGSLLIIAAQVHPQNDGKIESIITTLINTGADLDVTDRSKNTALIHAAEKGYLKSVKLLVQAGANVNLQNKDYETAILAATNEQQFETAEFLLDSGADLSLDSYGSRVYSPLSNNYEHYSLDQQELAVLLAVKMLDKYSVFNIGNITERWELERLDKIESDEIRKRLKHAKIIDAGAVVSSRQIQPHYPEVHKSHVIEQPRTQIIKITEEGPVVFDPSKQPVKEIKNIDYQNYREYLLKKDNKRADNKAKKVEELKDRNIGNINGCDVKPGANCPNTDFSNADLMYVNFSGANLQGSKFIKANLKEANFEGANLSGADFSDTYVFKNKFSNADLSDANLNNTTLQGGTFSGAILEGAIFTNIKIMGSDFTGAKWSHPDFTGATLMSPNFGNANHLKEALKKSAHLLDPVFSQNECVIRTGMQCDGIDLSGYVFPNIKLENMSLQKANLSGADLSEVILVNANLSKANLSNAILPNTISNSDISNANLQSTKFSDEKSRKNFDEVNLNNSNLTNASLVNLRFNGGTLEMANLTGANLSNVDMRITNINNTKFVNANMKNCKGCPLSEDEKLTRKKKAALALKSFSNIESLEVIGTHYQSAIELFQKESSINQGIKEQSIKHIELDNIWRANAYKRYANLALLTNDTLIITKISSLDTKEKTDILGMVAIFPIDCDMNSECKSTFMEYSDVCAVVLNVGEYVIDNQYPSWEEMIYCEGELSRSYPPDYLKMGFRSNGSEYPYYE